MRESPIIRAFIADDEPRAVAGLRAMLAQHEDVSVVGEASGGRAAAQGVRDLQPDVLFLDIEMPGWDGMRLAAELSELIRPLIVFVTAHDDRAVDAFAIRAADYLLKPVSDERLESCLSRIRETLQLRAQGELHQQLRLLLDAATSGGSPGQKRFASRIAVRVGTRSVLVPVEDVDWIEADGFCSILHVGQRAHVIRETLHSIVSRLDPAAFTRLHRSSVVNIARIVELRHQTLNGLAVVLRDGTQLPVSRRRRDAVLSLIGPSR